MPFRNETYRNDNMSNAEVERWLKGENSSEFFDNYLATFLNLCLKFSELFKFVKFHRATGTAVFKFEFRFKLDSPVNTVFWRDDKTFHVNSGASVRIKFPIEVCVVNHAVSGDRERV